MRKRETFAGIFAPTFKIACEFLTKNSRGAFSPEVFIEHFNACIIQYLWQKDNKISRNIFGLTIINFTLFQKNLDDVSAKYDIIPLKVA